MSASFTTLPDARRLELVTALDQVCGQSAAWRYSENTGALVVAIPRGKYTAVHEWAHREGLADAGGKWHTYTFPACNGEPRSLWWTDGGSILWAQFQPAAPAEVTPCAGA